MKFFLSLLGLFAFAFFAYGQNSELENLNKRAIAGDPVSQNSLALYHIQNGNKVDAVLWWKRAASQDYAKACVNLGSYYIEEGSQEAKYWYLKGAALRDSSAYRGLGIYFDSVEKDTDESLKWLKKELMPEM